jgi:hypothetical protein
MATPLESGPPPHSRRDRVLERLREGPVDWRELSFVMRIPSPNTHIESLKAEGFGIAVDLMHEDDEGRRCALWSLERDPWARESVAFTPTHATNTTSTVTA